MCILVSTFTPGTYAPEQRVNPSRRRGGVSTCTKPHPSSPGNGTVHEHAEPQPRAARRVRVHDQALLRRLQGLRQAERQQQQRPPAGGEAEVVPRRPRAPPGLTLHQRTGWTAPWKHAFLKYDCVVFFTSSLLYSFPPPSQHKRVLPSAPLSLAV